MKKLLKKTVIFFRRILSRLRELTKITIYLIAMLFGVIVFFALPYSKLIDSKFDTLPITNYCFAIMGGCASICFSWARNVDQSHKKLMNQISFCGERCFLAAVSFVFASAMKFFVVNKEQYLKNAEPYVLFVIEIFAVVAFFVSLIIGLSALYYILKLLSKHITEDQKFDEL